MEQINFWIGIIATVAFAVTGVLAIADRGVDLFGTLVLGVITAIGASLIRNVLAGRKNLLMSYELYEIPVTLACTAYVLILNYLPQYAVEGSVICILAIFGLRSAAICWDLRVPNIFITKTR